MEYIKIGLCAGRHPMPVEEYIFTGTVNPTDFSAMETVVEQFVLSRVGLTTDTREALDQRHGEDVPCYTGKHGLIVYVTGLTACTAAVIKVCALNGVPLTLMHYDTASGQYAPQEIFGRCE